VLLSRPARIGSALSGTQASAPPPWVVRLLGGRLLVQGAATLAQPGAAAASVSAAVDATHAASMVFVAAVSHRYRRAALINVAVAGASAAVSTKIAMSELDRHR
jgi:anti-sigma factor RsiW